MQNYKAIIFDFGGVILNIDFKKVNKAFSELGVNNFEDVYSQKKADPLFERLEEGKLSEAEFYQELRKRAQLDLTDEEIKNAWNTLLVDYREKALDTLTALKNKYRLYMLSNTNSIHLDAFNKIFREQIGNGSLENYFDMVYYSHQMGCRKPGKEIFEQVIKENNLSPSETLFIDDSLQNINTAKEIGLQTIFLKDGMGIEDLGL